MSPEVLEKLRHAGRVAAAAREFGARQVAAGARLRDVCEAVEAEIERLGGTPAFPVQSSLNNVAAHYCPSPEDETTYAQGDIAKLDVGVHVDGYVVDTAVTVSVGDPPENRRLVDAARAALDAAIAAVRPDVPVRTISAVIESTVRSYGLRPMRNLCGHGVGRWMVHCPPPIPNLPELASDERLPAGSVVAIEPFATDGSGLVAERGAPEVFRMDPQAEGDGVDPEIFGAIRRFRGLPFSRRQLARFPRRQMEETLAALLRRGTLAAYPPLVETGGRRVAQAEQTVLIGPEGVEVLTR